METLERRLDALERRIYGGGSGLNKANLEDPKAAEQLLNSAKNIGNAISKRDRIAPLFRRIAELDRYLDPAFGEAHGLSVEVKADLVLAQESKIRQSAKLAEDLEAKKGVLNSEAYDNVKELKPQLARLTQLTLEQRERTEELSEETLELVNEYNEAVETISRAFLRYDQILRQAEENHGKK